MKKRWMSLMALILAVLMLSGCTPLTQGILSAMRDPEVTVAPPAATNASAFLDLALDKIHKTEATQAPETDATAAPQTTAAADATAAPQTTLQPDATAAPDVVMLDPFVQEPARRANIAFSDMVYTAPSAQETIEIIEGLLNEFAAAGSAAEQVEILREIDTLTSNDANMVALANVQFSLNTTDATTQEHSAQVQEYNSELTDTIYEIYAAILKSPYYEALEAYYGEAMIASMRSFVESYDGQMAELQLEVDRLVDQYTSYMTQNSGNNIPLAGTENTFSEAEMLNFLMHYGQDPEEAFLSSLIAESLEGYYSEMYAQCNEYYSQIVALRNEMALLAGYGSYPEYAIETGSGSYSYEDIKTLIRQVRTEFVPVIQKIRETGEAVRGEAMNSSTYYLTLCPAVYVTNEPYLPEDELLDVALNMVASTGDMGKELTEYMKKYELLQVESSPTKESGAYTTFFNGYKQPIIFADSVDVGTIVHELGHALNYYMLPEPDMGERFSVGTEIAEVHSMGMEMLCMKFYEDYYGDGTEAAEAYQIFNALYTILQQTLFCEFEITLYENPNLGPEGRANLYSRLMEEYGLATPGHPYLNDGRVWVQVHHFFSAPIYVQNYTLAQTVSLEIWEMSRTDWDKAREAYDKFLLDHEELHFAPRLKNAGLSDPFAEGNLEKLASRMTEYFSSEEYLMHHAPAQEYYEKMMAS